jgi:mRNA interferase MazF
MMLTKRGDVVRVLFPNSNMRTSKRRPALVVQTNHLQTGLPQTIVAMISSNVIHATHPSRLLIAVGSLEGRQAGLRLDSVIMTDNLVTVLVSEIDSLLGTLPPRTMALVDNALRHTLNL